MLFSMPSLENVSGECRPDGVNVRLSIYLVERSSVGKAAVPNLIHHLGSLDVVLAFGSVRD